MPSAPVITSPWLATTRMPAVAGSAQRSTTNARAVARRKVLGTQTWGIFRTSAGLRLISTPDVRRGPRREQAAARFGRLNLTLILYNAGKILVLQISCEFLLASLPRTERRQGQEAGAVGRRGATATLPASCLLFLPPAPAVCLLIFWPHLSSSL